MIDCNEDDLRVGNCKNRCAKSVGRQRSNQQEDLNKISKYSDVDQDYRNDYDEDEENEDRSLESRDISNDDFFERRRKKYDENDEDADVRCLDDGYEDKYLSKSRIKEKIVVNRKEYYNYYDDYDEKEEKIQGKKDANSSKNKSSKRGANKSDDQADISIDKMTNDSGKSSATNSSLAEVDNQDNYQDDDDMRNITPPPPYEITSNFEKKKAHKKDVPKTGSGRVKELTNNRNQTSKARGGGAGELSRARVVNDDDTGYYSHN